MKRRHRAMKRKRATAWWVPRTSDNLDFPTTSCWANEGEPFSALGSTSGLPTRVICPIASSEVQAISPDISQQMARHPEVERWRLERIVGDFNVSAFGIQGFLDGFFINWGICRYKSVGDNTLVPSPTLNESALYDWLVLGHFSVWSLSHACFNCTGQATCPTGDPNGCDLVDVNVPTALTAFQFSGVPGDVWTHVDVKVKRTIRPEEGLAFVMEAEAGSLAAADRDVLSFTPRLRALLSKIV